MLDFLKPKKEPSAPSLYQTICGAIQSDGTLPRDFSLPRPKSEDAEQKLRFADGAFDGIGLYHMAPDKRDIKSLTEVVGLISAGSYAKAEECLQLFFSMDEYISMLPLIDDLQTWIIDHKEQISAKALYEFSVGVLKKSADVESVKFALSCLELLNTGENTQVRNLIKVFALSNEFTLYCLFIMRQWPDANAAIFDAAKHVSGWGRIHAVERLEPENNEMRRWLLTEGWRNDVTAEYSALTCVEKSGLAEKLKGENLDEAEFTAAGELIVPLLNEGPVAGISGLGDDALDFLADYLTLAEQRAAALTDFEAALAIRNYCKGQEVPRIDLISRANALLERPACRAAAEAVIARGEGFDFARQLGVPYRGRVMELLQADFRKNYGLLSFALEDDLYISQILEIAEGVLPLDQLSSGPKQEMGLGPAFEDARILRYLVQFLRPFPGRGEQFVAAALLCPVINCRNMALNVLEGWAKAGYTRTDVLNETLEKLKATETDEQIKQRLAAL